MYHNLLEGQAPLAEFWIQYVQGGAQESASPASSHVMWLLVQGTHFENHCCRIIISWSIAHAWSKKDKPERLTFYLVSRAPFNPQTISLPFSATQAPSGVWATRCSPRKHLPPAFLGSRNRRRERSDIHMHGNLTLAEDKTEEPSLISLWFRGEEAAETTLSFVAL